MRDAEFRHAGSFRVHPHRPGRILALTFILVVIMGLGGWCVYEFGREQGAAEGRMSRATEARLRIQIEDLRTRVSALTDERTLLARSRYIDESTFNRLEDQLERREQRIGHLEEELAFYRSLVSSAEADSGLNIERFSLFADVGREYQYELVLTRLDHDDTEVSGHVNLSIEGVRNGTPARVDLAELQVDGAAKVGFRFRYFQALADRIRLPEDMQPETVTVVIEPEDDQIERLEEEFAWDSLIGGGN